ncbi:MAG: hypothetical protein ACKOCJ_08335 [Burkholderiaceae bacterium]
MSDLPAHLRRIELPPVALRYSPRPLDEYTCRIRDFSFGPAASMLLKRSTAVWNLAWLGFDYEANFDHPFHKDPAYNVRVYHSTNYMMAARAVDISALAPDEVKVAGMLRYPAEEFVEWLVSSGVYKRLPLYEAYGDEWLNTVRQRAAIAQGGDVATELTRSTIADVADMSDAQDLLKRFML